MAYLVPTFLALLLGAVLGLTLVRAMALAVGIVAFAVAGTVAALLGGGWGFFGAGIAGPVVAIQLSYLASAAWAVYRTGETRPAASRTGPSSRPGPAPAAPIGRHDAAA